MAIEKGTEKEKLDRAIKALKGHTHPAKGRERACNWDQEKSCLRFKEGGARRLKDIAAARKYVEKNNYRLEG
jgi:hypothetical protein